MDNLSKDRRSANMRKIRSVNTKPELAIRKLCCELGYRGYRLHRKDLPGRPDIAWINRKCAIFVNGCFWHGHDCLEGQRKPKSNMSYWNLKITTNRCRDSMRINQLIESGWKVLVIWECELNNGTYVKDKIASLCERNRPNRTDGLLEIQP